MVDIMLSDSITARLLVTSKAKHQTDWLDPLTLLLDLLNQGIFTLINPVTYRNQTDFNIDSCNLTL